MKPYGMVKRGIFAAEHGLAALADMCAVALLDERDIPAPGKPDFEMIGLADKPDCVRPSHIGFHSRGQTLILPCKHFQLHRLTFSSKKVYQEDQRPPILLPDEQSVLVTIQMWVDLWVHFGSEGGMGGTAAGLLRQENLHAARDGFQRAEEIMRLHPEWTVRRYVLEQGGQVLDIDSMTHDQYIAAQGEAIYGGRWDRYWRQVDDWDVANI